MYICRCIVYTHSIGIYTVYTCLQLAIHSLPRKWGLSGPCRMMLGLIGFNAGVSISCPDFCWEKMIKHIGVRSAKCVCQGWCLGCSGGAGSTGRSIYLHVTGPPGELDKLRTKSRKGMKRMPCVLALEVASLPLVSVLVTWVLAILATSVSLTLSRMPWKQGMESSDTCLWRTHFRSTSPSPR